MDSLKNNMGRPPIKNTFSYKFKLRKAEQAYRKGSSISAIAKASGMHRATISAHLKSVGFQIKPGVEPKDTLFVPNT